jgi:hypothetical protein
MENINIEIDKNISQLNSNHEILDNQKKKIININNDLSNIEKNNSLSKLIIERLSSIYTRFTTSLKKPCIVDTKNFDNIYERNRYILEINNNGIFSKVNNMKIMANELNLKLDEQNEILNNTNLKVDECNNDIQNNSKSINKLF